MRTAHPTLDNWGIAQGYQDAFGQWQPISRQTRTAIRSVIGKASDGAGKGTQIKVLKTGLSMELKQPVTLVLEDGTKLRAEAHLPKDLPSGYHELVDDNGIKTRLLVTPGACYLPENLKLWGWGVQLYSLRSGKSWGMGDLKDLRTFGRWAARTRGCGYILANPLVAALPVLPQQTSPYYPSSRRFMNPLYLSVEEIPGASRYISHKIIRQAEALNRNRLIDRDAIFRLKMAALHAIWRHFGEDRRFETYCEKEGTSLRVYATFCALAEHFQCGWKSWPEIYRRPNSMEVNDFARNNWGRIRFHQWLQWLLHLQLKRAVDMLPLIHDLPVGIDPSGADAWIWQNVLARDVAVGAPPDGYNSSGQNWGIQPFIPWRLRERFYEPFRETVRAALRFGGGLRIDHVMALFRLYWIPKDMTALAGAFVHYPVEEMLAILAIESHRAKAWIIGEDLGTVEAAMRWEMRRQKILSCRVLWFEGGPTTRFPRRAMASVTTHDLFTIAGLWNGSDVRAREKVGLNPDKSGAQAMKKRLARRLRLKPSVPVKVAIPATYKLLARAPAMLLTATVEDALAVEERPNMPGTTTQWPNWSLALPLPLEKIIRSRLVKAVAKICAAGGMGNTARIGVGPGMAGKRKQKPKSR